MNGGGLPARPAEVDEWVPLEQTARRLHEHEGRLVDARNNIGEPLPAEVVAAHGLAALAIQHHIAARVLYSRWTNARDALTYGATVDQVADAMGLDRDELVAGLTRWADQQLRQRLITAAEHAAVLALVGSAS